MIIAKDEERNLEECLSTVSWADETIVVVDKASRDRTLEIAREQAEIVISRCFDDFASQRNAGLSLASGDWILAIDADERVTPLLKVEIERILSDPSEGPIAYRVPIRSKILGRSFSFSGTQHDLPTRLFSRVKGRWTGLVHETLSYEGEVGTLSGGLSHCTIPDMLTFLSKLNAYTSLEARALANLGCRFRTRDLVITPIWTFVKLYLAKQGFRDGLEGFVFCVLSGVSVAVRSWKQRELLRGGEGL